MVNGRVFSTVKELPRSNFFQGPVVAGNDDLTCLADAGTYLDKLDGIGINFLQVSMDISVKILPPLTWRTGQQLHAQSYRLVNRWWDGHQRWAGIVLYALLGRVEW